jgi:hypothetical protein
LVCFLCILTPAAAAAAVHLHAVCGSKWKKRALGMAAPAEQLQFVWHAARYIALCSKIGPSTTAESAAAAAAADFSKLQQLRDSILEQLPAEQRGHFSITLEDIQAAGAAAAAAAAAGGGAGAGGDGSAGTPSVSAISWMSVGDALEVSPADGALWQDAPACVVVALDAR